MTSNIGSQYLLDGIDADGNITLVTQSRVNEELKNHFRPEFLNRLDETIMFSPLSRDNIDSIIDLLVEDTNRRLADRELSIRLTDEAKKAVAENSYDPTFGARPLKRYMQKNVETLSARLILSGDVHEGSVIVIDAEDGALKASVE